MLMLVLVKSFKNFPRPFLIDGPTPQISNYSLQPQNNDLDANVAGHATLA